MIQEPIQKYPYLLDPAELQRFIQLCIAEHDFDLGKDFVIVSKPNKYLGPILELASSAEGSSLQLSKQQFSDVVNQSYPLPKHTARFIALKDELGNRREQLIKICLDFNTELVPNIPLLELIEMENDENFDLESIDPKISRKYDTYFSVIDLKGFQDTIKKIEQIFQYDFINIDLANSKQRLVINTAIFEEDHSKYTAVIEELIQAGVQLKSQFDKFVENRFQKFEMEQALVLQHAEKKMTTLTSEIKKYAESYGDQSPVGKPGIFNFSKKDKDRYEAWGRINQFSTDLQYVLDQSKICGGVQVVELTSTTEIMERLEKVKSLTLDFRTACNSYSFDQLKKMNLFNTEDASISEFYQELLQLVEKVNQYAIFPVRIELNPTALEKLYEFLCQLIQRLHGAYAQMYTYGQYFLYKQLLASLPEVLQNLIQEFILTKKTNWSKLLHHWLLKKQILEKTPALLYETSSLIDEYLQIKEEIFQELEEGTKLSLSRIGIQRLLQIGIKDPKKVHQQQIHEVWPLKLEQIVNESSLSNNSTVILIEEAESDFFSVGIRGAEDALKIPFANLIRINAPLSKCHPIDQLKISRKLAKCLLPHAYTLSFFKTRGLSILSCGTPLFHEYLLSYLDEERIKQFSPYDDVEGFLIDFLLDTERKPIFISYLGLFDPFQENFPNQREVINLLKTAGFREVEFQPSLRFGLGNQKGFERILAFITAKDHDK